MDRLVLSYIVRRAGPKGTCYPNMVRLIEDLEVSETAAFRAVRRLMAMNLISREPRPKSRKKQFVLKTHRVRKSEKTPHTATMAVGDCHHGSTILPPWQSHLKVQGQGSNEGSFAPSDGAIIPKSEGEEPGTLGGTIFTKEESDFYLHKLQNSPSLLASEAQMKAADILATVVVPKSLDEVLAKASPSEAVPKPARCRQLWTDLHALYMPGVFCPQLTQKQVGQLVEALKKLEAGGAYGSRVLADVVKNWGSFCKFIKSQGQCQDFPMKPHMGFFLKHVNFAPPWQDTLLLTESTTSDHPQDFEIGSV